MAGALFLVALASVLYGAFLARAGAGTGFHRIWFVNAAILLCLAVTTSLGLWSLVPEPLRNLALACAVVLLLSFVLALACALSRFRDRPDGEVDYLIVLGAWVRGRTPSEALRRRLDVARDYLLDHAKTKCVLSGARRHDESCAEADAMGDYLEAQGIDPQRLIRECKARSTLENICRSRELIEDEDARVCIVTSDFHLFRGVRLARSNGFPNACGLSAPSNPLFLPNNLLREGLCIIRCFLRREL